MNVIYLDPSAWVKRYFAEAGSDAVAAIFADNNSIACTRFGLVEVAAAIAHPES